MAGGHDVKEGNHTRMKYTGYHEFKNNHIFIVRYKCLQHKHFEGRSFESVDGTANNAATSHTPQNVATMPRHLCCEESRSWIGLTVTLCAGSFTKLQSTLTDRLTFSGKMTRIHT